MLNNYVKVESTTKIKYQHYFREYQSKSLSPPSHAIHLDHRKLKAIENVLKMPFKLDTSVLCEVIAEGVNENQTQLQSAQPISPTSSNIASKIFTPSPNIKNRLYSPPRKCKDLLKQQLYNKFVQFQNKDQTPCSKIRYQKLIQNLKPVGSEESLQAKQNQQNIQNESESQSLVKKCKVISYPLREQCQENYSSGIRVRTLQIPQNLKNVIQQPPKEIYRYVPFLQYSYQESEKLKSFEENKLVYLISDKNQALELRSQFWVDANETLKKRVPNFKWHDKLNSVVFMNMRCTMKSLSPVKNIQIKKAYGIVDIKNQSYPKIIYNHFQFEEELLNKYLFWQNFVSIHHKTKLKYIMAQQAMQMRQKKSSQPQKRHHKDKDHLKEHKEETIDNGQMNSSLLQKEKEQKNKLKIRSKEGSQSKIEHKSDKQIPIKKQFELKEIVEILPPTILLDIFHQDFLENLSQFSSLFSRLKTQGESQFGRSTHFETIYAEVIEFINIIKDRMESNRENVQISDRDYKYKKLNVSMSHLFNQYPASFTKPRKNLWIVKQVDNSRMGCVRKGCSTVIDSHDKLFNILKEAIRVYLREHSPQNTTIYPQHPWTYRFVIQKYLEDPLKINDKKCVARKWILVSQLSSYLYILAFYLYEAFFNNSKGIVKLQKDKHLIDKPNHNKNQIKSPVQQNQNDPINNSQQLISANTANPASVQNIITTNNVIPTQSQQNIPQEIQVINDTPEYISWDDFEVYQTNLLQQLGLQYIVQKEHSLTQQESEQDKEGGDDEDKQEEEEEDREEEEDSVEYIDDFKIMKQEMEKIIKLTMNSVKKRLNQRQKEGSFMILELDFLIDSFYNPYLAGINNFQAFNDYPKEFMNATLPELIGNFILIK